MELLYPSYVETTTSIEVNSGTLTAENLLGWDMRRQYVSDGMTDDTLTASIKFKFDETMTVERLALFEHNFKEFRVYYNGVTANTFALDGAHTTTSNFITNDQSYMYMRTTPVLCTSVSIDIKATMVADTEKAIGYFLASRVLLDFPRTPSSKNYKPLLDKTQIVHKLSDGGTRIHNIASKRTADIKFKYLEEDFRDDLKDVFDLDDSFVFAAFGTSTGWDRFLMECVWEGDFNIYEYSDDAAISGFSGALKFREI